MPYINNNVNYYFLFPCPQVADGLPGIHKAEILGLCDEVDILSRQLSDLCRRGHGDTPQAQDVARYISGGVNLLLITD
jgi:vinculin